MRLIFSIFALAMFFSGACFAAPLKIMMTDLENKPDAFKLFRSELENNLAARGIANQIRFITKNDDITPDIYISIGKNDVSQIDNKARLKILTFMARTDCIDYLEQSNSGDTACIGHEQPSKRLIKVAGHLFKERKRIVTVLPRNIDPSTLASKLPEGKHLYTLKAKTNNSIDLAELRSLLDDDTVFLMLPMGNLYNISNIQEILINTYHNNVPVIAYTQSLTLAGASLSIYTDVTDISRQTAQIIDQHIQGTTQAVGLLEPIHFSISINHRVLRSLGITEPGEKEIYELKENGNG